MYHVLMPVDTDVDRALSQAEYVAGLPCADEQVTAHILFVFTEDGEVTDEMRSFKSATRVQSVRRSVEYLEDQDVETSVLDMGGDAVDDILTEAEDLDVDSIVLGGRKRSPVGKAVFGSVSQKVILKSNRPVVVTGSNPEHSEE